jgi:hypothetical protein
LLYDNSPNIHQLIERLGLTRIVQDYHDLSFEIRRDMTLRSIRTTHSRRIYIYLDTAYVLKWAF